MYGFRLHTESPKLHPKSIQIRIKDVQIHQYQAANLVDCSCFFDLVSRICHIAPLSIHDMADLPGKIRPNVFTHPLEDLTAQGHGVHHSAVRGEKCAVRVKQLVGTQKIVTEQGFVEKVLKIRHFRQLARKNEGNFGKKREDWTVPALLTRLEHSKVRQSHLIVQ